MKFAHIADCHVGGWRDEKMKDLSIQAFKKTIEKCKEEKVDFLLIAGDLFNTAFPPIESIKAVVEGLKYLKEKGINTYLIAGSHDYSPSGKTMLDVIESAGLAINVAKGKQAGRKLSLKFTEDKNTGVKITGLLGKRGGLDRNYYYNLEKETLEKEKGYKIFLFHCALSELKPKGLENMESMPISLLPKGFNYYAGGHVHERKKIDLEAYKNVVYPGPTFPNSFSEIEKLKTGSLCIVEDDKVRFEDLELKKVLSFKINCEGKTPKQIQQELEEKTAQIQEDSLVTLRMEGSIKEGNVCDISFADVLKKFYENGAYFVMKNTLKLNTQKIKLMQVKQKPIKEIEKEIIKENSGQINLFKDEVRITNELMTLLNKEKKEGETNTNFEERMIQEMDSFINQQQAGA